MKSYPSGIKHIGARLRIARHEKGLSQHQLALRAGTNQTVVQKIENNKSIQPKVVMDLGEALDVNPAWLQFGEPYASEPWPEEVPKRSRFAEDPDFAQLLKLADQLINQVTHAQIAETSRLLALNLAHYQIRFGEIQLENFRKLIATQETDDETDRLVAVGMENLIGVLGLVTTQDEAAHDQMH